MTNYEKHKGETAAQMADAFIRQYDGSNAPCDVAVAFAEWARAEAAQEKPLPCPFCGRKLTTHFDAFHWWVQCPCGYHAPKFVTKEESIAAHNRVARAVAKAEGGAK